MPPVRLFDVPAFACAVCYAGFADRRACADAQSCYAALMHFGVQQTPSLDDPRRLPMGVMQCDELFPHDQIVAAALAQRTIVLSMQTAAADIQNAAHRRDRKLVSVREDKGVP